MTKREKKKGFPLGNQEFTTWFDGDWRRGEVHNQLDPVSAFRGKDGSHVR